MTLLKRMDGERRCVYRQVGGEHCLWYSLTDHSVAQGGGGGTVRGGAAGGGAAAANDDDDDDSDVGAPTEVVVSPSAHATPAMSVAADQPQGTPATWQDLSV